MTRRMGLLVSLSLLISLFATAAAVTATKKGTEGCTPGYWRNHTLAGVSNLAFETVFEGTTVTSGTTTLKEAAAIGGGGLSALVRHAAAAYLSAASGIDYLYSTADVVSMFNAANPGGNIEGTKNLFAAANEMGCPLN